MEETMVMYFSVFDVVLWVLVIVVIFAVGFMLGRFFAKKPIAKTSA
ncbi:MAG: hypothetical protein WC449_01955 [Candidatus Paceibacterota bacterium]